MTLWRRACSMDWNQVIVILGALGGLEGIRQFMKWWRTRRAEKRVQEAAADNAELETLRKQYDWLQGKYEALNKKVDELYNSIHDLETRNMELLKRNGELELALKIAEWDKCERPDDECIRRLPPRQRCRLKMLLNGAYDDEEQTDDDNKTKEEE